MGVTYFENLLDEITVPPDGILTRTLYRDENAKVVLFGFSPGQELSEHTAAVPVIIHILEGEGQFAAEGSSYAVKAGSWFHLKANTRHTVSATSALTMLLILVSAAKT